METSKLEMEQMEQEQIVDIDKVPTTYNFSEFWKNLVLIKVNLVQTLFVIENSTKGCFKYKIFIFLTLNT